MVGYRERLRRSVAVNGEVLEVLGLGGGGVVPIIVVGWVECLLVFC